jgi:hypothetical protein
MCEMMKMNIKKDVRKRFLIAIVVVLLLFQPLTVFALTSSEAKQNWYDAKEASREAQQAHRDAKLDYAADKTEENNQKVIETGKYSLQAALDEAEAWLIYVEASLDENPEVPDTLKETIKQDIDLNLAKIDELRIEVDAAENRLELGIVFLKMIGKYLELVTDVARNTGLVWVHIANTYADTIADYEEQMREVVEGMEDNEDILDALDEVKSELETARSNIDDAESEYLNVVIGGSPLLSFSNGNQHLRIAKNHMIEAQRGLREAYRILVG